MGTVVDGIIHLFFEAMEVDEKYLLAIYETRVFLGIAGFL